MNKKGKKELPIGCLTAVMIALIIALFFIIINRLAEHATLFGDML